MAIAQLILVRHGETVWNREGRIQGHLDSPLNPDGVAQAKILAERLRTEPFDTLISSDLGRARNTAQYIALQTGHSVILDARLRERHYGVFQGLTPSEAKSAYPEEYAQYAAKLANYAIPGGESMEDCFRRNFEGLNELAVRFAGKRIVVVTHSGLLGAFYFHVMQLPHVGSQDFTVVNAGLNWFTYENGQWRLDRWGDASHLGQGLDLNPMLFASKPEA
jgi:2,3-bisphosphoglycerate-dependent phosphoglycerate mutase